MMKYPVLLITFMCLSAVLAGFRNVVEYFICNEIEHFRREMLTGIPELELPVLDPYGIPTIPYTRIKAGVADVKIMVDKLKFDGGSKFKIYELDVDLQNLRGTYSVGISHVSGNGVYDLNGKIFNMIPLFGKGGGSIQINDIVCSGSDTFTVTTDGYLQVDMLDMEPALGAVTINLENMFGGGNYGKVVNKLLSAIAPTIFKLYNPEIKMQLNKILRDVTNRGLRKAGKWEDIQGHIPSKFVLSRDAKCSNAGNVNGFLDRILSNARPTITL